MKRCPFCAEEIQDEAVVCRWCGRDLDPNGQRFPTPRGVAFGAKGERYLFGAVVDHRGDVRQFGIWDADRPGPPIERFELLQGGRDASAARFRDLEAGNTRSSRTPTRRPARDAGGSCDGPRAATARRTSWPAGRSSGSSGPSRRTGRQAVRLPQLRNPGLTARPARRPSDQPASATTLSTPSGVESGTVPT